VGQNQSLVGGSGVNTFQFVGGGANGTGPLGSDTVVGSAADVGNVLDFTGYNLGPIKVNLGTTAPQVVDAERPDADPVGRQRAREHFRVATSTTR